METDCDSVSVCELPLPPSQALRVPPRAGYWLQAPMTYCEAVQGVEPLSNPLLPTTCTGLQPGWPVVTVQVKLAEPVRLAESVTVTVTLEVPAVVGLPVIRPVED